jgi:hypothetical protein
MDERVHLFGIRHHGPGSAASLIAALDALEPAAVLIEGPPEADPLIRYATAPGMRPPVALLAYAKDDPAKAIFFPFAVFSPEWQALGWSLRHERPVRFIDWPAGMSLASRPAPEPKEEAQDVTTEEQEPASDDPDETPTSAAAPFERDPLDRLAEVSGHADGESLWNALIESRGAAREVFAAIADAMATIAPRPTISIAARPRPCARCAAKRICGSKSARP